VANCATAPSKAFLASIILLASCGACGQTPPLPNPGAAAKALAPLGTSSSAEHEGLFTIDSVVTNGAGDAASDLGPPDFILLDNGQPVTINTLHKSTEASQPPPTLIFVLDGLNMPPRELTQAESAVVHFLRRNNGHLENRSFLYRLTRDGLFSSPGLTSDGNTLAEEVEKHSFPRTLWIGGWEHNGMSLRALGSIAIHQRDIPGRKIVVWIGPGWPVAGDAVNDFGQATELSTRLREARITLDNVNADPAPSFDYRKYLEGPRSQKDMQPERLALPVIALQTGGLVLDSSCDLAREIQRCAEEERLFYTLTFSPPHTSAMDEYHELRLEIRAGVAPPGLTARALTRYYNEPVYFDSPRPGVERLTADEVDALVRAGKDRGHRLANLELTERLSTPRLDALLGVLTSERERQALTADADLSMGLAPPAGEIADRQAPSLEEQRAIMGRTFDYLANAIPRLPDFYALRNTVKFEEPAADVNALWKMPHADPSLHHAGSEHATVLYQNGNEVVEKKQRLGKRPANATRQRNLETWGTFGPILSYVLTAAAASPGSLHWKRWEHVKDGDLAVFSYQIPSARIEHEVTFCCLPQGNGTTLYENRTDAFGEFAVNPETGSIMRLVINADLDEERDPTVPIIRSEIMVEYGPVELGGKTYICPQRSVSISRARSERVIHEWGMVFTIYGYFETIINDVTFGGYHKFGSESRMLPDFQPTE
jgi:VWFA-related protein